MPAGNTLQHVQWRPLLLLTVESDHDKTGLGYCSVMLHSSHSIHCDVQCSEHFGVACPLICLAQTARKKKSTHPHTLGEIRGYQDTHVVGYSSHIDIQVRVYWNA